MSRSSFSKAYEEIVNLEPMEMTFTIEDADLEKLHDVLKDINVKECPWFEVQDKYGVKAKYYREPRWTPCSERPPEEETDVFVCNANGDIEISRGSLYSTEVKDYFIWHTTRWRFGEPIAWMPLPSPYYEEGETE